MNHYDYKAALRLLKKRKFMQSSSQWENGQTSSCRHHYKETMVRQLHTVINIKRKWSELSKLKHHAVIIIMRKWSYAQVQILTAGHTSSNLKLVKKKSRRSPWAPWRSRPHNTKRTRQTWDSVCKCWKTSCIKGRGEKVCRYGRITCDQEWGYAYRRARKLLDLSNANSLWVFSVILPFPRPKAGPCDLQKPRPAACRRARKLLLLPLPNGLRVFPVMLPFPRPKAGPCDHQKPRPAACRRARKLLQLPHPNGLRVFSVMLPFPRPKAGPCDQ